MQTESTLRRLLDAAHTALAGGEAGEAERQAKAVRALVRAEREVAEFLAASATAGEDDEEAARAEIRRRIARFVEADQSGAPDEVLERIATGRAGP